ncbi:hypothetical protein MRB53_030104 [Persea americana]|uniref:Uncharacterized protein n=1 Tax=Persea americana TaxID=3435 RepID=A0ACC2KK94_PERAE|nr:hypothetical protein MRB53_030104 [Persea americana]
MFPPFHAFSLHSIHSPALIPHSTLVPSILHNSSSSSVFFFPYTSATQNKPNKTATNNSPITELPTTNFHHIWRISVTTSKSSSSSSAPPTTP